MKHELWRACHQSHFPETRRCATRKPTRVPDLCITGRRIPVYFHSEHRQLPWCRELWPVPRLEMNPADAARTRSGAGRVGLDREPRGARCASASISTTASRPAPSTRACLVVPGAAQADSCKLLSTSTALGSARPGQVHRGRPCARRPVKVYKATPRTAPFGNPCPARR